MGSYKTTEHYYKYNTRKKNASKSIIRWLSWPPNIAPKQKCEQEQGTCRGSYPLLERRENQIRHGCDGDAFGDSHDQK
ncbi:hypothetical protein TNCV_4398021 [Trichonephila clavipes]|nr:hypothetical protein TNCV_4398021 [Trichonephila clavipes]